MGKQDAQEQEDPDTVKEVYVEFVKWKGKKSIDQGEATPTDQLKDPVPDCFIIHVSVKSTKSPVKGET